MIDDDSTTRDTNVRLMFNATPPNHTPIAIRDTAILRFHIASLKRRDNEDIDYREPRFKVITRMRRTMMKEENAQEA